MGKHIAIVGYGSASLIILKMLQDLPAELRQGWRVTIFERREGLGGQWLPDDSIQDPVNGIPLTGLYPELRTNTPVNMMCYPFSMDLFPPGTDLFPHWTVILRWLQDYAQLWGLYDSDPADWERVSSQTNGQALTSTRSDRKFTNTPADEARRTLPRRILCNRELYSATWSAARNRWKVVSRTFPASTDGEEYEDDIAAIIDATGHLVHPAIQHWKGEEEWLQAGQGRSIMHSAYYRGPEQFRGKTVVVMGSGPSGLDGSLQISKTAQKLYHSVNSAVVLPPNWPFERRARVSHFDKDGLILSDGTRIDDVDAVYVGSGFIIRYEYLERGGVLQRRSREPLPPLAAETCSGLVSTDLYVRPLWEHTVSFADAHGPGSLFFVGNIMSTSYRFSNAVQAALIAWILADPSILPSREDMLRVVAEEEARTVALGRAVEKLGHRQGAPSSGESEVYQRRMLAYLQSKGIETGSVHDQTGVVLEPWRVEVRKEFWRIMRGWARLEKEGRTKQMIAGLEGEQAYADLCVEVLKEQTIVEKDRDPNESEISGWH